MDENHVTSHSFEDIEMHLDILLIKFHKMLSTVTDALSLSGTNVRKRNG